MQAGNLRTGAPLLLVLILLVAVGLRWYALDAELWYDEIITYLRCADRGLLEIATTYDSQNQHLLYSLLARLSLSAVGDSSMALRLPAALFGVLSIAALYLLARDIVSQGEALLACALLAVSYHHVWFSQNARGYTAMLFFTLIATWLLLRVSRGSGRGEWAAYGLVCALGVYTHLTMLFVLCGHLVWYVRRLARLDVSDPGLVYGFGLCAFLVLLAYAPVLPELLAVNATEGRDPRHVETTAAWASSQIASGLGIAFGHVALGALVLVLALLGAWRLERARSGVIELFALPVVVTVAVVFGSGHHLWPRLLFFAIGFGALAVVAGAMRVGRAVGDSVAPARRDAIAMGMVGVLIVASLATVPRAYGAKQRFQEALALIDREHHPGDVVAAVAGSATVFRDYYHAPWHKVFTLAELQEVRAGAARTWIVYTFPSRMRSSRRDILALLDAEFTLIDRFDGTLSDGTVMVWRSAEGSNDVADPSGRGGQDGSADL